MREYIRKSTLPALSPRIIEKLEGPITIEGISKAIGNLPMGKSPGPDGLTNAYYKKFVHILAIPLCSYLKKITASNPLPPEALLPYVTVLPEPGKDPQYCANY